MQHQSGVMHERVTGLGRDHAPRPPLKQLHAHGILDAPQALARGGQLQVRALGALRDAPRIHDAEEQPKIREGCFSACASEWAAERRGRG